MGGKKRELIHKSWESLKEICCRRHDDWMSYKKACEDDPELKSFDANLQSRTTNVISILQNKGGGVSTDFLGEAIAYVKDFNQQTVDAIMVCKEVISSGRRRKKKKNKKMSEESFKVVVEEYVNNSQEMLDFCSALDQFLKSARKSHLKIEQVVQQCEIETVPEGGNRYARISEKLKSLEDAHHYDSANNLLEKIQTLQLKNKEFPKKLKLDFEKLASKEGIARASRKAVNKIFITTVAAECVTAAATLALCNPAAATAIGATISPTTAGHVWALSLIEQYEKRLENEKDILHTMDNASAFAMKELAEADVKFLIDNVVTEIDTLFRPAPNSAIEGQVETAIKNIKTQLDVFLKKIEDLENKEKNCRSEILSSRDKVVRSMKA